MEKEYKIQKLNKDHSREALKLLIEGKDTKEWMEIVNTANRDYLSWDEFRNKTWSTDDQEAIWSLVKLQRNVGRQFLPVRDKNGHDYAFLPNRHLEFLHEVDLELGGNLIGITNFGDADKKQFIRRNLIEESIASSKLEGASTSREAARRMLSEGRKPKDRSERMIVNNHAAMVWIEEEGKNKSLTLDLLHELHRKVTAGTLSNPDLEGQMRATFDGKGKRLVIKPWDDETIAYVTPDREFVDEQIPRLISFANDEGNKTTFIHPLIKAIVLHFWVGLLHPFEDGNGRLARILFYWYMLRKGYWAFSYLSLSERILKSPKQYAMAYINTEQDDYDLNYFIQYNIEKLTLARTQLLSYLQSKIQENRQRLRIAQGGHGLNQRQIRLLQQINQGELPFTSVAEHHQSNPDIGYVSATSDLKTLVERGFLRKQKNGRNVIYLPTDKLERLFR